VYDALFTTDFATSRSMLVLLWLRAIPSLLRRSGRAVRPARVTLDEFLRAGFGIVDERPGREVVLGLGGKFWQPAPRVHPLTNAAELATPAPGEVNAAWSFAVHPGDDGTTLLRTETRILAADAPSRRRFRAYWLVVRPFSGWIRRVMLRAIRREAERAVHH
jgi:hypothetical protein